LNTNLMEWEDPTLRLLQIKRGRLIMERLARNHHPSMYGIERLTRYPQSTIKGAAIIILMTIIIVAACARRDRVYASEISWNELVNAMTQQSFGFYNWVAVKVFGYVANNPGDGDEKRDAIGSIDASTYRAITLHYKSEGVGRSFTGSAAARANAQIGTMKSMASTGGADEALEFGTDAGSITGFWDTITITANQISAAFIQINGNISGKLLTTSSDMGASALIEVRSAAGVKPPGQGNLALFAEMGFYQNGDSYQFGDPALGGGQTVPFSVKIPYLGKPTIFTLELGTEALLRGNINGFGDAAAEFEHTLVVTGLQVLDASGIPITNATYVTASGYTYNGSPAYNSNIFLPLIIRECSELCRH
jgi:hypothetical protein